MPSQQEVNAQTPFPNGKRAAPGPPCSSWTITVERSAIPADATASATAACRSPTRSGAASRTTTSRQHLSVWAASEASEGIHAESSVFPQPSPALAEAVEGIHREFGQAALVEQYVGDRELNVSVLQTGDRVVPSVYMMHSDAFFSRLENLPGKAITVTPETRFQLTTPENAH